jgi:AraC-like DNA-binding protein
MSLLWILKAVAEDAPPMGVLAKHTRIGGLMSNLPQEYFRYLPISERDTQWDLYVTGAGLSCVPVGSSYPRSVHPDLYQFVYQRGRVLPEYQIVYITRGAGQFESRPGGKHEVVAGNVLLLFPGVWHLYHPTDRIGWDEYWVSYNGDYVTRLVERGFISPQNPVLNTGLDDTILQPYLSLLERVRLEPPGYQQLIAANTMEILAAVLAAVQTSRTGGRASAAIRKAKIMLAQSTEEVVDMEGLASTFHMSYAHFRRVFKQQSGLSPYQYHLQLRIHRAREMLHSTTLAVGQVAARLNFPNPYYFSKIFKKKTGMSPSLWRRGGRESQP